MLKEGMRCGKCMQLSSEAVGLDCGHAQCLNCLKKMLLDVEREEMLRDEIEIECGQCSYETILSIALAYKLVRPTQHKQDSSNHLVCLDCLDECFPVDQLLNGKHISHKIETLERAAPLVKNLLGFASKNLQQRVDNLVRQNEKLLHCKSMLNDAMNANLSKIRFAFDHIRQEISRKQSEVVEHYQQLLERQFRQIDEDLSGIRLRVMQGRQQLQRMFEESAADARTLINCFIEHQNSALQLSYYEQSYSARAPVYLSLLKDNQQGARLESFKYIVQQIRTLSIFEESNRAKEVILPLTRQYFDIKRKEVLNGQSGKREDNLLGLKVQNLRETLQSVQSEKRFVSLRAGQFLNL